MYSVYILKSSKTNKHYIGHAADLSNRIKRHNQGLVKSTKNGCPWKLIYQENYSTKSEAYRRELKIKSYKGGVQFKQLIISSGKSGEVA